MKRFFFFLSIIIFSWQLTLACSGGGTQTDNGEPVPEKSKIKDAAPDRSPEPLTEKPPEKPKPPEGVGKSCRPTPVSAQGTCPDKRLLCGAISSKESICFENCTDTGKCTAEGELCRQIPSVARFPICVKVADKGEPCGLKIRTICPGDSVEPPLYCVAGKCTEKPKDGWEVGQPCTPPSGGDPQSDCKKGLMCIEHLRGEFRCIKKCNAGSDCPKGESCWDVPFGQKLCVIAAKEGERCNPLERRFCKSDDKDNPLRCEGEVCKAKFQYKKLEEPCTKSLDPTKPQGNCQKGLLCLGVSRLKSICHRACNSDSDCPTGEICALHPNVGPGDPIKACVKPAGVNETCDLTQRLLCRSTKGNFLKCQRPDEDTDQGKCIKVEVGDACINNRDCGPMVCVPVTQKFRYCLMPCSPQNPSCPGNGACLEWGQQKITACMPTGPKARDEACVALQPGGKKLNTSGMCKGGLTCVIFKKNSSNGICMKIVAQCQSGVCGKGYVCIPINQRGLCGLDCSGNTSVCKPPTVCLKVNKTTQICGPRN